MTEAENRSATKYDWCLLGLLVVLILPLRLWLLHNTEVTARDSIGYIRYALRFEKEPWRKVCETSDQHPGYPVLVWLMSQPIRALDGETTPENMQLSTQMVSFFASFLLLFPMYFLGRQFFDRKVSFFAALLYQYLPISAQHLSDGISEPAYLVLLTSALLQAVHAVRERSVGRCALCGLLTGMSYLIRPEGLLILPAFSIVLIALQYRADWRCSWKQFAACGSAMAIAAMLVGSIYIYATGRITNKISALEIFRNIGLMTRDETAQRPAPGIQDPTHLFAASFAKTDNKALRVTRSVWALFAEISQGFHYIAVLSAMLGFWSAFGLVRRNPGFWFLLTYALMHMLVLISLAMSVDYVSDRHVMILVIGGSYFAVVGVQDLARRLQSFLPGVVDPTTGLLPWWRAAPVGFAVLYIGLIGFCLPKSVQRLHGNRVGNHVAGLWLSKQLREGDIIEDDHSWSHFFSGLILREGRDTILPSDARPTCFVVTTRSRDPLIDAQRRDGAVGPEAKVVYYWPEQGDLDKARVVVYRQPRDFDKNRWRKASD